MKKILSILLAFVLTFGCMSGMANAMTWGEKPADGMTEEQPFAPGTGGSSNFRIPCMVTLNDGTIVTACDARWNHSSDACGLDTIVSYSKDNGATWNYTFANYLGDYGNGFNYNASAFIDPSIVTDGETVYMIADIYPAGIAINTTPDTHRPLTGSTGFDGNDNLLLAKATDAVNGLSASADRISQPFDYYLEKIEGAADDAVNYYQLKNVDGTNVEGYTVDAYFNIKGEGIDTNIFCGDSPYYPWPADYLYMTKSADGGATWSIPSLINVKRADEATVLVCPGRGVVTSTGRIVFPVYEHTSGREYTSVIYSDDNGDTWTRSANMSNNCSEAGITEADGRLYMFTRHGGYYVSEDNGATWTARKDVGISYDTGTQLSAITYSEKIDGKTAIMLSVPGGPSRRTNGKIFTALVQEDGSLDWAYDYSVTSNGAPFAYSCLTELKNEDIAILYEHAGAALTYKNLAVEDVVAGAAIGDIWFHDAEGPVSFLEMQPGDSVTLTLDGALEDATLEVTSSNEDAVLVMVEGTTVTVEASEAVTGFEKVAIIAKAGDAETTLTVHVAEADNYEIVNMSMGDTVTFTEETGNYEDSVDLSVVDSTVAEVIVTGNDGTNPDETEIETATLQLGTTVDFTDSSVPSANALFTVASTFQMSATDSAGNTVYVEPYATTNGNGYPNVSSTVAVTVEPANTEKTFYIKGNGGYLHFHDGRFDRVTNKSGFEAGCSFMFYEAAAEGEAGSVEIPGFVPVSAVKPGGQYLIVSTNAGGYHVMYPTTAKTNGLYTQVAKVTGESVDGVATVQLGNSAAFNGEVISAADCLYTYTTSGTTISGSANGTTVYLNLGTPSKPTMTTSENIRITESAYEEEMFEFYGTANGRYLHFHDDSVKFNRCGSNDANHSFEVYKVAETPSVNDAITGYTKVTELNEILAGGQFLIARQGDDNNYYVLYPTTNTGSVYNYVGKVQNFELPGPSTEITIHAVGEGQTSVEVNGLTYYVIVDNADKDVVLEIGESMKLAGTVQKMDETQTVVALTDVEAMAPYTAVEEVSEGEFLIANGSYVVVNAPTEVENASPTGLDMEPAVFEKGELEAYLWTLTAVDGGYTIQDVNEQYMTFNGNAVVLSDTAQTFVIADDVTGGMSISSNGMYLNNFGRANNRVAGWTGNDCPWVLYKASAGVEITAVDAGTTTITIGGVNYNIIVKGEEIVEPEPTPEVTPEVTPEPTPEVTPDPTPTPDPDDSEHGKGNACVDFKDVTHGAWYEEEVQFVYDAGLMSGNNGLFNPSGNVTRAQVVTTLYRLAGEPKVSDYSACDDLVDVEAGKWYTDAVCWAYNTGVTTGDTTTKMFNMNTAVTRQQLASFFFRYADYMGLDIEARGDISSMLNANQVSSYAKDAVEWAVGTGLISGSETPGANGETLYDLKPQATATRAQISAILMRFCENYNI